MKKILSPRVLSFIQLVQETERDDVADEFMKTLNQCADPCQENLTLMLSKAKGTAPGASEFTRREQSGLQSALIHCNS